MEDQAILHCRENKTEKPLLRKVIRITGYDSPNCRLAMREIALGLPLPGTIAVPGLLTWNELQWRKATWSPERFMVGVLARFCKTVQTS